MRMLAAAAAFSLLSAASAAPAPQKTDAELARSAARIEAHVRFLADDLLEGREAGTRGHELAALYVATQFRLMGLEPAGENGSFFQTVPMRSGTLLRDGARLAVAREGRVTELVFEEDFLPSVNFDTGECALEAPMVFVGQGVYAPEFEHDDFAGVDLRGKVAVLLANAPARFPNDQRAFHASGLEKLRELERRGAVGALFLGDPENEARRAWHLNAPNWARPGMRLLNRDGRPRDTFPGLGCRASMRMQRAEVIFAGAPHTTDEVWAMLAEGRLRAFDFKGTIAMASRARLEPVASRNVLARVPGHDPRLAGEHLMLTAHLDHLGIGRDATGTRSTTAPTTTPSASRSCSRQASSSPARAPGCDRSVLLLATTAEEKGLLGAKHFIAQPTVPVGLDRRQREPGHAAAVRGPAGCRARGHRALHSGQRGATRRRSGRPGAHAGPAAPRSDLRAQRPVPVRAAPVYRPCTSSPASGHAPAATASPQSRLSVRTSITCRRTISPSLSTGSLRRDWRR